MTNVPRLSGILDDIYGSAGYSTAFSVTNDELTFLRDAIFCQWISRIEAVQPACARQFREGGLEAYGDLAHLLPHETTWGKEHRVLPRDCVSTILQFESFRRLTSALGGDCRISNVIFFSGEVPDHPEVYWRLVRPNVPGDVGALHADKWFHNLLGRGRRLYGEDETTVKMWLAIYTEPGLNGLYVVPGSHARDWRVRHVTGNDGHERPGLDEPLGTHARRLIPTFPGQAILFGEDLLHGGSVNTANTSRVSMEMTFILRRAGIES